MKIKTKSMKASEILAEHRTKKARVKVGDIVELIPTELRGNKIIKFTKPLRDKFLEYNNEGLEIETGLKVEAMFYGTSRIIYESAKIVSVVDDENVIVEFHDGDVQKTNIRHIRTGDSVVIGDILPSKEKIEETKEEPEEEKV